MPSCCSLLFSDAWRGFDDCLKRDGYPFDAAQWFAGRILPNDYYLRLTMFTMHLPRVFGCGEDDDFLTVWYRSFVFYHQKRYASLCLQLSHALIRMLLAACSTSRTMHHNQKQFAQRCQQDVARCLLYHSQQKAPCAHTQKLGIRCSAVGDVPELPVLIAPSPLGAMPLLPLVKVTHL